MKQIHTYGFCRVIAGATSRQCYVRFTSKPDIVTTQTDVCFGPQADMRLFESPREYCSSRKLDRKTRTPPCRQAIRL